ncbi:MAG: PAS domain S-box protein, partial [Planctomycetes bacterium]|nr:PAS domain S-box protein [Planctomycetota bacterium]
ARRTSTEQLRTAAILASLAEPVLAVDEYKELVLANPSAEALFDFHLAGTEKRALSELVRCEELLKMLEETQGRKAAKERSREIELTDTQGRHHWYSVTARSIEGVVDPTGDSTASPRGTVAVLRDISSQKEIQKRNAEFVSAVSHEMKTPLSGIKAYVELLADGDAEDEKSREEFLGVINSQADRLQRLIDNMLNLARIEAGVVKVSKQSQSLNEVLEEALNVIQHAADKKGIELVRDLSPLYLGVLADRDMLLQAAINLLSNAVKYTPAGRRVTLRSRVLGSEVVFEVEDQGVGLSPEDQQKVFEKFYRVKKDQNMAVGTGLGLPLARHIVQDIHGGQLTVESQLDVGSKFSVRLPGAGQMH